MKRLVGGVILLCLTALTLNVSESEPTYENITEPEILEQLTNLKKYIPNPHMIKPVWVQLKNGDTDEIVVVQGELKVVDTGEFEIIVFIDGYKLKIHVEFTQATLDDDTPIDDWYIAENDAKYLFTSDAQNIGAISELPIFENIVDADGNPRFTGGNISTSEFLSEKIDVKYAKWTLSGSHLMIVFAFISNEDINMAGQQFCLINVPSFIYNKVYPMTTDTGHIAVIENIKGYIPQNLTASVGAINPYLIKDSTNLLTVNGANNSALEEDHYYRFVFDLIIE